ncbi:MAG TPA: cupin domain-containing protein [Actinomycetota bacterium]|jgi:hypothetical protein|nr:cupin domain-containing protein [Actinomycetota bacterium]
MARVSYVRLFADEDGESHLEDGSLETEPVDTAPPAPPLGRAWLDEAVDVAFVLGTEDWGGDVPHPTPYRQLMCVLDGAFEVETTDGTRRRLDPGSVLLLEDTTGKGHATRVLTEQTLVVAVRLAG